MWRQSLETSIYVKWQISNFEYLEETTQESRDWEVVACAELKNIHQLNTLDESRTLIHDGADLSAPTALEIKMEHRSHQISMQSQQSTKTSFNLYIPPAHEHMVREVRRIRSRLLNEFFPEPEIILK
jgi:hypothetical protein